MAVVASSSWSHSFLTAKNHYLYPDLPSDRARFEVLRDGQLDRWQALTTSQLEDAGQQELLNWVCLAGAMSEVGRRSVWTDLADTSAPLGELDGTVHRVVGPEALAHG